MDESRFTTDQIAMAKECKTPQELRELAISEGAELDINDLNDVSGGWDGDPPKRKKYVCRDCGGDAKWEGPQDRYVCKRCGRKGMYPSDLNTVDA